MVAHIIKIIIILCVIFIDWLLIHAFANRKLKLHGLIDTLLFTVICILLNTVITMILLN